MLPHTWDNPIEGVLDRQLNKGVVYALSRIIGHTRLKVINRRCGRVLSGFIVFDLNQHIQSKVGKDQHVYMALCVNPKAAKGQFSTPSTVLYTEEALKILRPDLVQHYNSLCEVLFQHHSILCYY